jgi:hypothetical protein
MRFRVLKVASAGTFGTEKAKRHRDPGDIRPAMATAGSAEDGGGRGAGFCPQFAASCGRLNRCGPKPARLGAPRSRHRGDGRSGRDVWTPVVRQAGRPAERAGRTGPHRPAQGTRPAAVASFPSTRRGSTMKLPGRRRDERGAPAWGSPHTRGGAIWSLAHIGACVPGSRRQGGRDGKSHPTRPGGDQILRKQVVPVAPRSCRARCSSPLCPAMLLDGGDQAP